MSFKSLLVHVEFDAESERRLRIAVDLAHRFGATLIGVGGSEPLYLDGAMTTAGYVEGMVVQLVDEQDRADISKAKQRFDELATSLGSAATWLADRNYPDLALQSYAAGADLIVASAHRGPRISTPNVAELVLRCGLPILAIPVGLNAMQTKTVLVAWKNTREARRAISDALPFLIAANKVTVASVCHSKDGAADVGLDEVIRRLQRHGVAAEPKLLMGVEVEASERLITFAKGQGVDLIVAGAYGHTRLGEWLFGGVTEGLLAYSPLPVLFSH